MEQSLDDQIRFWTLLNSWGVGIAVFGALLALIAAVLAGVAHWKLGPLQEQKEEILRGRIASAQERTDTLETELVETKKRASSLERKTKQRALTGIQRTQLQQLISGIPTGDIEFECPSDDPEAAKFANELLEVFGLAGWNIMNFARSQFPNGANPQGLHLGIRSTAQEPIGQAVVVAFEKVGLNVKVSFGREDDVHPLVLLVGGK